MASQARYSDFAVLLSRHLVISRRAHVCFFLEATKLLAGTIFAAAVVTRGTLLLQPMSFFNAARVLAGFLWNAFHRRARHEQARVADSCAARHVFVSARADRVSLNRGVHDPASP
jgi:hypothetical protein